MVDEDGKLRFDSLHDFQIDRTSVNAGLLGLAAVAGGGTVVSNRQAGTDLVANEVRPDAGRTAPEVPPSVVLGDDVTLVFKDGDGELCPRSPSGERAHRYRNVVLPPLRVCVIDEAARDLSGKRAGASGVHDRRDLRRIRKVVPEAIAT